MSKRIPVLLDTDIGSDIDDAVALAYLLCKPECELVGISTVSGDVQKRSALAEIVCRAAGRAEVPIVCGRREVLVSGPGQPLVPQYDAVAHLPHRRTRLENEAVEFMRTTIRERPGEIVLLSIGPFSNLALLFALDPEIPSLVREIVSMGGHFFGPNNKEWNAVCDPIATSIVCAHRRPRHRFLGLDVTMQCRMEADEVRKRFVGEPLKTVSRMAERWFEVRPEITFHDPLAAAVVFNGSLCTYETGRVSCPVTGNSETEGETHFKARDGTDQVASSVRVDAFFTEFFSVFSS